MHELVSIVVPVYNKEDYLDKCIESVLQQTYSNFQLILVDDGSTDNSLSICRKYERKDKRIMVVPQENQGVSVARNKGLLASEGRYLMFLDADDFWIYNDGLETLLSYPFVKKDDFVYLEFNRQRYLPSQNSFYYFPKFPESLLCKQDTEFEIIELIKNGIFPMSACTKLINRKFLIEHDIYFITGMLSEDYLWYLDLLLKTKNGIYFTNYFLYGNRSEISSSRSSVWSEKKIDHNLLAIDKCSKDINQSSFSNEIKESLLSTLAYKYCLVMVNYYLRRKIFDKTYREKIKKYEWILKYDVHPKVKKVNMLKKYLGRKVALFLLTQYMLHKDKLKLLLYR